MKFRKPDRNTTTSLIFLVGSIFMCELAMMRLPSSIIASAGIFSTVAQASLLTLVAFPLLYLLYVRPMNASRQTDDQFRKSFNQAAVGLAHVSLEGAFLQINDRWCNILGYSREELMSRSFQDLTHPDDLQSSVAHLETFLSNQSNSFKTEKRYFRKNMTVVWTNLSVSLVRHEDGTPWYFISALEDISERKLIEEALQKKENKLNVILESTADGILAVDAKGRVLRTNQRFNEMWHIPQSLVNSKDIEVILRYVMNELVEPESFISKVRLLHASVAEDRDVLHFKDGRIFERYSAPIILSGKNIGRVWSFRDITDRKRAEIDLQNSEEKHRQLFDQILSGIMVCEVIYDESGNPCDHRFIGGNPAFEEMTGLTIASLIGRTSKDLPIIWPPEVVQRLYKVAISGEPIEYERYNESLGRYYETRVFSPRKGQFAHLFNDVTKRKRTEEALRESEERYRSIIHASPDNITIADMQGRIIMVSPIAIPMFGFERPEEALGLLITDFLVPEDRERALRNISLKLNASIASSNEYRALRRDGSTFDIEVNSDFIRDIDGQPRSIVVIARDISQRKQDEKALRESNKKFRTLFESSRDALMTLTPPSWSYTSCNKSTMEMFRVKNVEEFLLYGLGKVSPERQPDGRRSDQKAKEMIDTAMRNGSHFFEWTHKRANGDEFPATVLLTRMEVEGKTFLHATVRDITEIQRAQKALVKSKNQYDSLAAHIPVGIYLLHTSRDGAMSFDYVSPKIEELLGVDAESILSNPQCAFQTIHPDDIDSLVKMNNERIQEPRTFAWEGRIEVKEIPKWVRIDSTPELLDNGDAVWHGVVADITERKQTEKLLYENRERLRSIYEGANIGLAIGDLTGRFLEINPAMERILGYGIEEINRKPMLEHTHPDDIAADMTLYQELLNGKRQHYHIEKRFFHKDGHIIWTLVDASLVRDENGVPQYAICMIEDITERKHAEEALRESEAKLRAMFDNSRDALSVSKNGIHTYVNSACVKLLGYENSDQVIGRPILEAIAPTHRDVISRYSHLRAAGEDVPKFYETRGVRVDGTEFDVEVNTSSYELNGEVFALSIIRDITDRKRAEEEMRASEEQFRFVFEHVLDGISIYSEDPDPLKRRLIECNNRYAAMAGRSREELLAIGNTRALQLPAVDSPNINEAWSVDSNTPLQGLFSWVRPDGRSNIIEYVGVPIMWRGNPHTIGIDRDTTERKRVEDALRESEAKFRAMFDSSRDAIGVSKKGIHIYANPSYLRLFGFINSEEMIGTSIIESIAGSHREQIARNVERRAAGEKVDKAYEMRGMKKDGTEFDTEVNVSTYELDGEVFSLVIIRDITERKNAEMELRKLSLAVEQNPASIVITDPTGTIEYVNPKFTQITGYTFEEVRGNNPRILKSGEMSREEYRTMWETILAGNHWSGEFHNKKKNGELFWERASISPVTDKNNVITNFVAVKEDITELKHAEDSLRQAQKLESIGTLAGGIAHDFNNVLGGIMGYTEMSLQLTEKDSKLRRNLLKVLKATDRAKHLIDQILTFSRKTNSQKSIVSIRPLIKEALDLLRASIPSSVIIDVDLDRNTKPVLADPTKIHEVLLNLATNAVHAMHRKGTMTVRLYGHFLDRTTYGQTGEIAPGEYTVIQVTDTGCGMDAATLSRAFEPFFTTKAVNEGTGMGLSVVLGVIRSLGGNILVESELGKGTTFKLFFPVAEESVSYSEPDDVLLELHGSEQILFVDDEKMMVDMAIDMLTPLGYGVIGMSDSMDALALLKKPDNNIDVLITDQTMPHMTGIELAKETMKFRKDLPIILCTGYSTELNPERATAFGVRQILMKPFRVDDIGKAIRKIFDNNERGR